MTNASGPVILESEFLTSAPGPAGWPAVPAGVCEICFCGRSNVGKSSLLNALLGRKALARVSGTPGRTRLLNFFRVRTRRAPGDEQAWMFADLPGYGYAKVSHKERGDWRAMVEGYLENRAPLAGAVLLVDGEVGVQESDTQMLAWLDAARRPALVAATKMDRVPRTRRAQATEPLRRALGPGHDPLPVSATTREGLDALWDRLFALRDRHLLRGVPAGG
jgi:GTP-binding protein